MKTAQKLFASLLWLFLLPAATGAAEQPTPDEALRPETGEFAAAATKTPERLRVVSFNVHYAQEVARLAESLKSNPALEAADVFLLQEIESYPAEGASRTRKLAEALGLDYVYAPARITLTGGTHGLAILSRYPLRDIEVLPLPRNDLGRKTRRRIALGATVEAGGQRLRLYNVHLDTRINIDARVAQLAPVLEAARHRTEEVVVLGGDFNTNPFRWAWGGRLPWFRSNQAAELDAHVAEQGFTTPLADSGSTTKRKVWKIRVDSIYVRGLEAKAWDVEREVDVSDHFPVWLEVAWPPATSTAAAPRVE
jgi:endonuclease/exonuclease/phosphatase family metal-dependent hydrolase